MICRAIPYEGKEPYIFLSYCHKDAATVYPLLEQMVRDGYRIWYDDGNHAGDDWLENIANHLNGCTICLAMLSEDSSASHNCKSEINEAIAWNKKLVAVLLMDFKMPLGMRLQLSTLHYLKKAEYPSDLMLLNKVYETEDFVKCKAAPGSLPMREFTSSREDIPLPAAKANKSVSDFIAAERADISMERTPPTASRDPQPESGALSEHSIPASPLANRKKKPKIRIRVAPLERKQNAPEAKAVFSSQPSEDSEDDEPETIFDGETQPDGVDEGDDAPTVWANEQDNAVLIRLLTGTAYIIRSALTRIGRSAKRCDVVINENGYIGNCHAEIIRYKQQYYLRDLGSANGTFVNDARLSGEEKIELKNATVFRLYDEAFLFLCDSSANRIAAKEKTYFLKSMHTQGVKLLQDDTVYLDRSHKWEDGTLSDEKISRNNKHARVTRRADEIWIEDLGSRNGTYLNGCDIREKGAQLLKETDQIRLGDTILEVGIISLQGDKT